MHVFIHRIKRISLTSLYDMEKRTSRQYEHEKRLRRSVVDSVEVYCAPGKCYHKVVVTKIGNDG